MILSFKTKINGKPSYFPEKIITGLLQYDFISFDRAKELFQPQILTKIIPEAYQTNEIKSAKVFNIGFDNTKFYNPKIHTIRKDDKNRWKAGTTIDFFINARQKDMFRFAPKIPVVSVQKIEIVYSEFQENGKLFKLPAVWIDGKLHYDFIGSLKENMRSIAINDGFENIEDFFAYFNEDFEGKIIHWTDFKY